MHYFPPTETATSRAVLLPDEHAGYEPEYTCIAVHSKLHCPHFTPLGSATVSRPTLYRPGYTDLASAACGQPAKGGHTWRHRTDLMTHLSTSREGR